MAIPDFQTLMMPLLRLCADGLTHSLAESVDRLGEEFNVSMEEKQVLLKSGQTRLYNRVAWTSTYLRKAGLLDAMGAGKFRISDLGRRILASAPPSLDVAYLAKEFPSVAQFLNGRRKTGVTTLGIPPFDEKTKTWVLRPDVTARVISKIEDALADPDTRTGVLQLMAFAIENADEEAGRMDRTGDAERTATADWSFDCAGLQERPCSHCRARRRCTRGMHHARR